MRSLEGRTVLITGAAGGIGNALAREAARRGAHLVLTDVDATRLDATLSQLPDTGRRHRTLRLDVRDRTAWDHLASELDALDLLVHNAGVTVHDLFADQSGDDVDWLLDINLRGPMHGTQAMLPLLRRSDDAHILLISSMSSLFPVPTQSTYGASKAALRNFGRALGIELSVEGIGVTTVLPGTIATPFMTRARTHVPDEVAWMAERMKTVGTSPETVARIALDAVGRGRAEVTAGLDARLVWWFTTLFPGLLPFLLRLGMRARASR